MFPFGLAQSRPCRLLSMSMILCGLLVNATIQSGERNAAGSTGIVLKAFSVLPGEWIAYADKPVDQKDLDPFAGRYLLAGKWPEGVTGPDDRRILLGRDRLAATRILSVKAEEGGRVIRLTADPAASPLPYRLTMGRVTIEASFTGLAADIGPNPVQDAAHEAVLPRLADLDSLAAMAKLDSYVAKIEKAWNDPKTRLNLRGWLRLAEGTHKLKFISGRSFTIAIAGEETPSGAAGGVHEAIVTFESGGQEAEIAWTFAADAGPIEVGNVFLACSMIKGGTANPLPEESLLTPWLPEALPETPTALAPPPYELTGGDPARGALVFESAAARCVNCHKMNGKGGAIGPELSGLRGTRPELVFQHINAPSERIHPGYPSFSVALRGGQVTMGVVRAIDREMLEILDTDARGLKVSAFDVTEIRPSSSSVMPAGLAGALGETAMRDLIAYLTKPPESK